MNASHYATDATDAVLVNEAFTRRMGWLEPPGKTFDSVRAALADPGESLRYE